MPAETRLLDLVQRWKAQQLRGKQQTVEELCSDCPELADELRRRIAELTLPPSVHDTSVDVAVPDSASASTLFPTDRLQKHSPPAPRPRIEIPGYEILEEIGRGGMGVIVKARHIRLNRMVAIKMILAGQHADDLERSRFQIEAESVARLHHPNIVQIFDINEHQGNIYLALELVEGSSLDSWIGGRPKPIAVTARLMRTLASAMHYAHERGVIHRDLKPHNILLADKVEGPQSELVPKITDFGLAKQVDEKRHLTHSGHVMGTPAYMAPEQAKGDSAKIGPATDVYSLGVILYELLTGSPPFAAESGLAILNLVVSRPPKSPMQRRGDCPAALAAICLKCLAKDPADRYPTAAALADDLGRFLGGDALQVTLSPRRKSPGTIARWGSIMSALLLFAVIGLAYYGDNDAKSGSDELSPAALAVPPVGTPSSPVLPQQPSIRVGILHSQTGPMAINERPVVDATLLAIDEINAAGGILGRPLQAEISDGRSNPAVFASEAERLITQEDAKVIFGCWTSASRKAVKEVVERQKNLLMYPVAFEGLEQSPNIVYTGAVPNQHILPTVKWCYAFLEKRRVFLAGSDQIFSVATNAIIKDELGRLGREAVGEQYLPFGSTAVDPIIAEIRRTNPDVILCTLTDESIVPFFRGLRKAGISPDKVPTISFNGADQDMILMDTADLVGDYIAGSYFETLTSEENQEFLRKLQGRFGPQKIVTDAMESAYVAVHLWARAVAAAESDVPEKVLGTIGSQRFNAPSGMISVDPATLCSYRHARIAKIESVRNVEIVWSTLQPLAPCPFPPSRTRESWESFLVDNYSRWQGWSDPAR